MAFLPAAYAAAAAIPQLLGEPVQVWPKVM